MWYKFDVQKFGWQMMPPVLRGQVMQGLLSALLEPLVWLASRLGLLRAQAREKLASTGQVISIVETLRRAYNLHESDVYITDAEGGDIYLYTVAEGQTAVAIHPASASASPTIIRSVGEGRATPDFYVHLPDFLEGEREAITRLIERVKPAGRNYQTIYYTYG